METARRFLAACNRFYGAGGSAVNINWGWRRTECLMISMFSDLYDAISFLGSWRWPVAEGKITEIISERLGRDRAQARLAVAYEFWVERDEPYTGECFWRPALFSLRRVASARRKVRRSAGVRVRYRPDDPSVNRLDGGVARLLKEAAPQRPGNAAQNRMN